MEITFEAALLMSEACADAAAAQTYLGQSAPTGWRGGAATAECASRSQAIGATESAIVALTSAAEAVNALHTHVLLNGWLADVI